MRASPPLKNGGQGRVTWRDRALGLRSVALRIHWNGVAPRHPPWSPLIKRGKCCALRNEDEPPTNCEFNPPRQTFQQPRARLGNLAPDLGLYPWSDLSIKLASPGVSLLLGFLAIHLVEHIADFFGLAGVEWV
jgi:hypothetical protein